MQKQSNNSTVEKGEVAFDSNKKSIFTKNVLIAIAVGIITVILGGLALFHFSSKSSSATFQSSSVAENPSDNKYVLNSNIAPKSITEPHPSNGPSSDKLENDPESADNLENNPEPTDNLENDPEPGPSNGQSTEDISILNSNELDRIFFLVPSINQNGEINDSKTIHCIDENGTEIDIKSEDLDDKNIYDMISSSMKAKLFAYTDLTEMKHPRIFIKNWDNSKPSSSSPVIDADTGLATFSPDGKKMAFVEFKSIESINNFFFTTLKENLLKKLK